MTYRKAGLLLFGTLVLFYQYSIFLFFSFLLDNYFFFENEANANLFWITILISAIFLLLVKPISSIILGSFADSRGLKRLLIYTSLAIATTGFLLCLSPNHETLGFWAIFLFFLSTLPQTIFIVTEIPTVITYMYEESEENQKGWFTSLVFFSMTLALTLAVSTDYLLNIFLSEEQLLQWGWRIPFILSAFAAVLCAYLRSLLPEPLSYKTLLVKKQPLFSPVKTLIGNHKKNLFFLTIIAGSWISGLSFFSYFLGEIYIQAKLIKPALIPVIIISLIASACLIPFIGKLSDKIGYRLLALLSGIALLFIIYPASMKINNDLLSVTSLLMLFLIQIAFLSFVVATAVLFLKKLHLHIRVLSFSFACSVGAALISILSLLSVLVYQYYYYETGLFILTLVGAYISLFSLSKKENSISISGNKQ